MDAIVSPVRPRGQIGASETDPPPVLIQQRSALTRRHLSVHLPQSSGRCTFLAEGSMIVHFGFTDGWLTVIRQDSLLQKYVSTKGI
jgi:hypothetical protein